MAIPHDHRDALPHRARLLRESLQRSCAVTDQMVAILGSFDHRLSELDTAMRPTQVRTHAIRVAHENIDKTIKSADVILSHFDLSRRAEYQIIKGPHEDLEGFLDAVNQLRSNVMFFSSNKNLNIGDGAFKHATQILNKTITKLEEEFKELLSNYSKPMEPDRLIACLPDSLQPSSGHQGDSNGKIPSTVHRSEHHSENHELNAYKIPTLIPPRILPLLHNLAYQLDQSGRQQQCLEIYRGSRTPALEQTLRKLGVEKLSKDDVQKMQWDVLESKIGNWIYFMRIAVKLLFAGERVICDKIFQGMTSLREQCYAEVTSLSVTVLLSFGDAVAKSKRSPEKLFVILDMYETMREHQPEITAIFEGKACSDVREAAMSLRKRLAQTAQETFSEFEEAVEKDATKTIVLDGTVHPLTSYVINYVKFLFDYQTTLKQLFLEFDTETDPSVQLANVTLKIMQALQNNLEGKSKQYKDPALTYLFLMNNVHYMVRSVRRSEAKESLGDDWIQRHRRIVQQNANQYRRAAWNKIVQSLTVQGLASSIGGSSSMGGDGSNASGASKTLVKERFKSFNMQFEELHQKQSQWTVPDPELRESLRLSIAEILLPAYRSFLRRFGSNIDSNRAPNRYVRYSVEDLERMLGEFFESKVEGKSAK